MATVARNEDLSVVATWAAADTAPVTLGKVEGNSATAQFSSATGTLEASNDGINFDAVAFVSSGAVNDVVAIPVLPRFLRSSGTGTVIVVAWGAK